MSAPTDSGYAPTDGVDTYWASFGAGGTPAIVVHGGHGEISMVRGAIDRLARRRRVIAVELQGHGHTRDADRPLTYEQLGDDLAGVARHLGLDRVDLVGYSLGAGACLRGAIQHPELVRRLVVVSIPFRRDAWFPEIRAAFDRMDRRMFELLSRSPLYAAWRAVAPDPEPAAFMALIDKVGELQRRPYDWGEQVCELPMPVLLAFADADSFPPSHAAEFFALLGGGARDAGWDGSQRPPSRLAILAGRTHYDMFESPALLDLLDEFLTVE
jgi:pimeloyl-ACP methyl ester carboxylesterase